LKHNQVSHFSGKKSNKMVLTYLVSSLLPFFLHTHFSSASTLHDTDSHPCTSYKLPKISIPNAKVLTSQSQVYKNFSIGPIQGELPTAITNLAFCEVNVTLTHTNATDAVLVQVWLPSPHNWNGRLTATGGVGWAAGEGATALAPFVSQGFVAASTDAGLPGGGNPYTPAAWALEADGSINEQLLTNFASRSIHDMAVVSKAVAAAYYGKPPRYSYWNGCSTGGRQGMVAAQMYPQLFDGILAGAPAMNWPEYTVAEQWPLVVMKEENYFPTLCEMDAIVGAAVKACDGNDGVKDGVINEPGKCKFNPLTVVGHGLQCSDGTTVTISKKAATVVKKIWQGPVTPRGLPLWPGLEIGASVDYLANTTVVNNTRVGMPFFVNDAWIRYFVKQNPNFDISSLDSAAFSKLFSQSSTRYDSIIGSANPDLSALRDSGHKLISWHGLSDQLIFPQGTVKYYQAVQRTASKKQSGRPNQDCGKVDDYFRLFLAPGVDHCGVGPTPGAVPTDLFAALMLWVENGTAPEYLQANTLPSTPKQFSRKVCRYPFVAVYDGKGDNSIAESFQCVMEH
jgi:hypothetical protein